MFCQCDQTYWFHMETQNSQIFILLKYMSQIYIFKVMVLLKIHVRQLGLAFLRLDTEKWDKFR